MYPELVKVLRREFEGRPPSDQLEWEVHERLKQLKPGRTLYAIWKAGRVSAITEDAAYAPVEIHEEDEGRDDHW